MGFLNGWFGDGQPDAKIDWNELTHVAQLDGLVEQSNTRPILVFKHSTRCGISRMVLKRFESEFDLQDKVTPYFLDLLAHRDVSDAISQRFNVVHQSPQVLVIKDGRCVYDVSHEEVSAVSIAPSLV